MTRDPPLGVRLPGVVVGFVTAVLVVGSFTPITLGAAGAGTPSWSAHGERGARGILIGGSSSVVTSSNLTSLGSIALNAPPIGAIYDDANPTLDVITLDNNLSVITPGNGSTVARVALPPGYVSQPVAEAYDGSDNLVYVAGFEFGLCTGCEGPWTVAINGSTYRNVANNT